MTKLSRGCIRACTTFAASLGILSLATACATSTTSVAADGLAACTQAGQWIAPAGGTVLPTTDLFRQTAASGIVLLGESHSSMAHHRWQTQMLAGLYAIKPDVVVGFEMFPRSVQPALDQWSTGDLSQAEFLKESRWGDVWGYDADLYMPLFDLARQNRLPMVALNVNRSLVSQVGQEGWDAIEEKDREGITRPAPAGEAYKRSLGQVFLAKIRHGTPGGSWSQTETGDDEVEKQDPETTLQKVLAMPGFQRFVDAQLVWDRAMAEALAQAQRDNPGSLIVGVMGRGHVEHGYGVPHQLAALGVTDVTSLIPIEAGDECRDMAATLADAVFLLDPESRSAGALTNTPRARPQGPRLGVVIEAGDGGVKVLRVVDGSVAAAAKLSAGDLITEAAGVEVETNPELITVIRRQAPGTWLPLKVTRDGEALEIIAKFPTLTSATN